MKMSVFSDVAPCSLVETDRRFRNPMSTHRSYDLGSSASEMSVDFNENRPTQRNNAQHSHIQRI
jgi:hypothetical protein